VFALLWFVVGCYVFVFVLRFNRLCFFLVCFGDLLFFYYFVACCEFVVLYCVYYIVLACWMRGSLCCLCCFVV